MFDFITALGMVIVLFYAVLAYFKPGVALVTVAFVAFALGYAAVVADRPECLLLVPVLLLLTLIVIAVSNRDPESRQWAHHWASVILAAIAVILVVVVAFVVLVELGAGAIVPLFFFLGIVAIIACLIGYGVNTRKSVAVQVVSTLGGSMRQNLPLPMALDCAAADRADAGARTFRRIKKWLVQGYSVVESLRRGYPQCPSRILAMLAAAERLGQLPAGFEAVRTDMRLQSAERRKLQPVHPFYPVVILAIMFLLLLGLMTFVLPTYKTVLEEMVGGQLPWPTRVLLRITGFVVYDTQLWLLLVLLPFALLPVWLRTRYGRRRPEKPLPLTRLGDLLKWHLPILHWFEKNYSTLQTAELLRLSLDAGCPVNEAIAATLDLDVNLQYKKRLRCWHQRVERGGNVAQAARDCGLGRALAWTFDTNVGTGETPAGLEMLESFCRSNYSYRVNLARFILWPCAIIALGATVGFVVVGVFLPLISVLTSLSSVIYP